MPPGERRTTRCRPHRPACPASHNLQGDRDVDFASARALLRRQLGSLGAAHPRRAWRGKEAAAGFSGGRLSWSRLWGRAGVIVVPGGPAFLAARASPASVLLLGSAVRRQPDQKWRNGDDAAVSLRVSPGKQAGSRRKPILRHGSEARSMGLEGPRSPRSRRVDRGAAARGRGQTVLAVDRACAGRRPR
jgi:hypothetical protein